LKVSFVVAPTWYLPCKPGVSVIFWLFDLVISPGYCVLPQN
jgi:hypothetical protein